MGRRSQLAEILRDQRGPDFELAEIYLAMPKGSLLAQLELDEGMFGFEIWAAAQALKIRNRETPLSKWILSDRKEPCPNV